MSSTRASRPTSAPFTWKSLVPGPQMCHPEPLTTPPCLPRLSPSRDASGGGGWGPCGFDDGQHTPSPPGPPTRDRRQDQCPGDAGTSDHKLGVLETTGGLLSATSGGLKSKISVGRAMHPPKDLGGNPSCLFQLLLAPGIPCGHMSPALPPRPHVASSSYRDTRHRTQGPARRSRTISAWKLLLARVCRLLPNMGTFTDAGN